MASFDMTAANAGLKELYTQDAVEALLYNKAPFLALVAKDTDFEGENLKVPIIIGDSQGTSAVFTTAQANQTAAVMRAFLLTRTSYYSVATLDRQTMLATRSNMGAFLRASKLVIDRSLHAAKRVLASSIYRSGTGSIGRVSGSLSSGVITLASPSDVVNFEYNQTLQANATDGGGTPRAALGYVVAVNRSAGTVTVSTTRGAAGANPSGWGDGDYLLIEGNNNAMISGLAAWIPTTAPSTSDSFFGVNRSTDPTRLAGQRYDASAMSIEEGLTNALMELGREGGAPDYCFTNFSTYAALQNSLGSKVVYTKLEGPARVVFEGIKFTGPNGTVTVVPDLNCPANRAYLLQLDTWKLGSLLAAPHIVDDLGDGTWLRVANADAGEVRIAQYANLCCHAPGWNSVVTTSA
jgi:hypothetical protein